MNGDTFILFTLRQGGRYAWKAASRDEYDKVVEMGWMESPGSGMVFPALVAFGTIEANHDFRLKPEAGPRP